MNSGHGSDPFQVATMTAVLCGFLLSSDPLRAALFHVCDCQTGAETGCVSGNDTHQGSSSQPWQSYERARLAFANIDAGDAIAFCRGGAWSIDGGGQRWVNPACSAENRCRVTAYRPEWATDDAPRPLLLRQDGQDGFSLADGGTAEPEQGYVFENLDIRSSTGSGNGFFIQNDVDDVLIRDVRISGFRIGVYLAGSNACSPVPGCDGRNERIRLERALVTDNRFSGWLGSSNDSVIADSVFERNGSQPVFDHNIYLSDTADEVVTGMRVIGNRLYRSALDQQGICRGVSLVVHGQHNDLIIEGNVIEEDIGQAAGGCWGIAVDPGYGNQAEAFNQVVIRGNLVRNVGNQGIGVASCADCLIENNVIIQEQPTSLFQSLAIAAPNRHRQADDQIMDRVTIRNNSIWFGPHSGGRGIRLNSEGVGHVLVSNAILYTGSSVFSCFQIDPSAASYLDVDYNQCHATHGSAAWVEGFGSLNQWQNLTGLDAHSSSDDPGFADPQALDLSPASAAASLVNAGHPARSASRDFRDRLRDSAPDRGAFEWQAHLLFHDRFSATPGP